MNRTRVHAALEKVDKKTAELVGAYAAQIGAEKRLENALKVACPIGSNIVWEWSDRCYSGPVLRHGYGDRIEVRNATTGRTRWITSWNILRGLGLIP